MSTSPFSDTQSSSQCSRQQEIIDLKSLQNQVIGHINPEVALQMAEQIAKKIKNSKHEQFDQIMKVIVGLLGKGYGKQITRFNVILQTLMDRFCGFCKEIQNNSKAEMKIFFILSTIAELIKEAPPVQLSLKKGFILSLLLIDSELVGASPIKRDILAVLGVLYECISRQIRVLQKFQLLKSFKKVLLENYSLLDQHFSLSLFNKALYSLAIQGEPITESELAKFGVFKTLERFLGAEQASLVIKKLKSMLEKLSASKKTEFGFKRSEMVAEN